MAIFHSFSLNLLNRRACLPYRQYATKYTKTLNMPVTKFPNFVKKTQRPKHDELIREKHFKPVYQWQRKHLNGKEFVLHDGPPYANGDVHMGHAVNKILKDFILRHHIINGNRVHYKPGWDCHGLPIEMKAKAVKNDKNPLEIRKNAREFATSTIEEQKKQFESWGVIGDWANRNQMYRTYDAAYIQNQLNLFHELYGKKLIFRDFKPVYWSPSSKTALAEAEIEYKNLKSPSLYIRFKLKNVPESLRKYGEHGDLYALIWTTTPWTLPANQAISFNANIQYSVIRLNDEPNYYIIGTELIPVLREKLESFDIEEVASLQNSADLNECTYLHPIDRTTELPFLSAGHVTSDVGTGLVHTAPSHGFDDYLVCLAANIPIKCLVDQNCQYTADAPDFLRGKSAVDEGNQLCLQHLANDTIQLGSLTHSCPIDWRTKQPVIINATHQWFIDISAIRDDALAEIEKIQIFTTNGAEKSKDHPLSQRIKQRPYWCISRQRVWGTPIPVFYHKDTDQVITSEKIVEHLKQLLDKQGNIDFWWSKDVSELIPSHELERLNLNADDVKKGNDILDIWFDSGISWSYALDPPHVADLYLEGIDQFTGWFQSSLITSVASRNQSPFKSILVHGFVVDENGKKMSKSLGNVTSPKDIIDEFNVDTLRWWVAGHLAGQSAVPVKQHLLEDASATIHKIRKVLRYLVGYMEKYEPSADAENGPEFNINIDKLSPLDRYMLNSLAQFEKRTQSLASDYRFPAYINAITKFVSDDLSALYIDSIKDRMYSNAAHDTKDTLNILYAQFCIVNKVLWPIVPHLVEEVWSYYSKTQSFCSRQSIAVPDEWHNTEFDSVMDLAKQLIAMLRENIKKTSWYYDVVISASAEQIQQLQILHPNDGTSHNDSQLCELLQVQSIELRQSPTNQLTLERQDNDIKLCDRCRRFAISNDSVCQRCDRVLVLLPLPSK